MRQIGRAVLLGSMIVVLGCGDPSGPSASLEGRWEGETVTLENVGRRAVYYLAAPAEIVPLMLWYPCVDPDLCPHLDPGESVALPVRELPGWSEDTEEVMVYWWIAVVKPGVVRTHGEIRWLHLRP